MPEPISATTALKVTGAIARPLIARAGDQWKRRGASSLQGVEPGGVDREFEEALDVLTRDVLTIRGWLANRVKGLLSARPEIFDQEEVREWLRTPTGRDLMKEAAMAVVIGRDTAPLRERAVQSYGDVSGDSAWWGGVVFDFAVPFLALTLDAKLSPGERTIIAAGNRNAVHIGNRLEHISEGVAGTHALLGRIGHALETPPVATDALERYLVDTIAVEERSRLLADDHRTDRIRALGQRVVDGDLSRAPDAARIAAFRLVAATIARTGSYDEAEIWLSYAVAAGADDLAPDRARIASLRGDHAGAAALLADRSDRASIGILVDMVQRRDGPATALDYVADHVRTPDMPGFLIQSVAHWMAGIDRWIEAETLLSSATDEQIDENPILLLDRARLRLAMLRPSKDRIETYENVGVLPQPGTMRNDQEGARLLAAAIADLVRLEPLALSLRHKEILPIVATHRLFAELASGDRNLADTARARLLGLVADPATVLEYAWIALAFDVEFDRTPMRKALDRARLIGGWTDGQLATAFQALIRVEDDHEGTLSFLSDHRDRLASILPPALPIAVEVDALARSGRIPQARELVAQWRDRLDANEVGRLETMIAEQEGANPVAARLLRFETSGSEVDLLALVQALAEAGDRRVGDYSIELWRRRRRVEDAVRACNALHNAGRDRRHGEFVAELGDGIDDDPRLSQHAAWAAYRDGILVKAADRIRPLRAAAPDDGVLRQLEINIAIEGGDWKSLAGLLRQDLERSDARNARQLLQAADLAHVADDPIARDLTRAAAAKVPEDAHVLLHAFTQALRGGHEDEEAGAWFSRATELSGEAGPVQRRKIRDFVEYRDSENERLRELDGMVMSGQIPLAMAAAPLGATLSELILSRLAGNVGLDDARRRLCLPLVAGNRVEFDLTGATRVGFDPNSLLCLQLCGLLGPALDAFPEIFIPAGTLPLLLNDRIRSDRGQPGRADRAARLRALAAEGRLDTFDDDAQPDSFLVQYGVADSLGGTCVHGGPLYEPGSLMEEVRDPAPFADRLAAPTAIVDALAASGEIGEVEKEGARRALSRLGGQERQIRVDLDRPIVVDFAVLHALEDAEVLEPLLRTGARVHVGSSTVSLLERQVRERADSIELTRAIEAVRASLADALRTGRAKIGPFHRDGAQAAEVAGNDDEEEEEIWAGDAGLAPHISLLELGSKLDAIVSADRFVNRHGFFTGAGDRQQPVVTVLDVIDHLGRTGAITPARRDSALRKLREAGIAMIPMDAQQIVVAAAEGNWKQGAGRAVRAVADSLHLPLLRGAHTLPEDRHWVGSSVVAVTLAARGCWKDIADDAAAEAAADFLFINLPRPSALAGSDASLDAGTWADGLLVACHSLLAFPADLPRARLPAYMAWWHGRIWPRLQGRDARHLPALLERLREMLVRPREPIPASANGGVEVPATTVTRFMAGYIPERLLERLLENAAVRIALRNPMRPTMVDDVPVASDDLTVFLTATLAGADATLSSVEGELVAERGEVEDEGTVAIKRPWGRLRFDFAGILSEDNDVRTATLARTLAGRTLAPSRAAYWRAEVALGSPSPTAFMQLMDEVRCVPEAFVDVLLEGPDGIELAEVAAVEEDHLRAILDPSSADEELADVIARVTEQHADGPSPAAAARAMAALGVSPDYRPQDAVRALDDAQVAKLCQDLLQDGDIYSLLSAFGMACDRLHETGCREAAGEVVKRLLSTEGSLDTAAHDLCIATRLILPAGDNRSLLPEWPLALRRCALVTHAGHAARALGLFDFDRPTMLAETMRWNRLRYQMAGLAEVAQSPDWRRDWLMPKALAADVVRRMDEILEGVAEDARPPEWVAAISSHVDAYKAGGMLAYFEMPGPLEPFARRRRGRSPADVNVAEMLDAAAPEHALNLLIILTVSFRGVADEYAVDAAVLRLVERCVGELEHTSVETALNFAVRWRRAALADQVLDRAMSRREGTSWPAVKYASWVALASTAHAEPGAQREALDRGMRSLAFGTLDRETALDVLAVIEALADAEPEWADTLDRVRSAVLLAA